MSDTDSNLIAELFARDPMTHTDEDEERIIAYFRSNRHTFHQMNKAAGGKSKSKSKKDEPKVEVDLDDILGDL